MIEVKNLSKSFGEKGVLSDLNFSVAHGQSVAIVGKSGAGKSVLLKCLIGLVKPDEGTIYVDNKLINSMSFGQLQEIRSNIGMVFQFGALFDSMTVGENISLALQKLTKLSGDEITERVFNSLEEVDMVDTEDLMPSELSGGMKKRVGIARAIAIKPAYLFYDEPTTGLDPVMTDSINRLILKFQNTGEVTSVIITHEMRTVYDVADRVLLLHEGKIWFDRELTWGHPSSTAARMFLVSSITSQKPAAASPRPENRRVISDSVQPGWCCSAQARPASPSSKWDAWALTMPMTVPLFMVMLCRKRSEKKSTLRSPPVMEVSTSTVPGSHSSVITSATTSERPHMSTMMS